MGQGENPKSWMAGLPESVRTMIETKTHEFSFVPSEDISARQDDQPGKLEDQIIYRFELGRWLPLEGVHTVINIKSTTMAAGRRVFVSQVTDGPFVAISQDDRESG